MLFLSGLSSIALTTLSIEYRVCCCSVTQSCLTLCHPMDCSLPALSVHRLPALSVHLHLPQFAQVHVHCIGHDIQPSNPLIPSFLSPLNLSSIRDFSNESAVCIRWSKYWSFSFSISPSSEYSGLISLKIDWFDLLAVQGLCFVSQNKTKNWNVCRGKWLGHWRKETQENEEALERSLSGYWRGSEHFISANGYI